MPNYEQYQKRVDLKGFPVDDDESKYNQAEVSEQDTMDTPTQRDAPPTGFDTPSPHPIPSNPPPAGNPSAHKPVRIGQSDDDDYSLGSAATLRTDETSAFRSPQLESFYRRTGRKGK